MKYLFFIPVLVLLHSCMYPVRYTAQYHIASAKSSDVRSEVDAFFQNRSRLNAKLLLSKDERMLATDTLGYYGRPYHYFKVWTTADGENNTLLSVDYTGYFHYRYKTAYKRLLSDLNDSIRSGFDVQKLSIRQEDKSRPKKATE